MNNRPAVSGEPLPIDADVKNNVLRLIAAATPTTRLGLSISEVPSLYFIKHRTKLDFRQYNFARLSEFLGAFAELEIHCAGVAALLVRVKEGIVLPLLKEDVETDTVTAQQYAEHGDTPISLGQLADHAGGVFQCAICERLAVRPLLTLCGHIFCLACIHRERQLRESQALSREGKVAFYHCPVCNLTLPQATSLFAICPSSKGPLLDLWKLLSSLSIRCVYKECQWTALYDRWVNHVVKCQFKSGTTDSGDTISLPDEEMLGNIFDTTNTVNQCAAELMSRWRERNKIELLHFSEEILKALKRSEAFPTLAEAIEEYEREDVSCSLVLKNFEIATRGQRVKWVNAVLNAPAIRRHAPQLKSEKTAGYGKVSAARAAGDSRESLPEWQRAKHGDDNRESRREYRRAKHSYEAVVENDLLLVKNELPSGWVYAKVVDKGIDTWCPWWVVKDTCDTTHK